MREENPDLKHDKNFICKYNKKKYNLKFMLALVTQENLHSEINTGKPIGNGILLSKQSL